MKRLFTLLLFSITLIYSCSKAPLKKNKLTNNVFYDKAFKYKEIGNIDSAYRFFDKAKNLFLRQKDSLGAGKCLVNMAIISTDNGDYFSGQEISLSALSFFDIKNKKHHTFLMSNFNNMGIDCYKLGDYENALKFYTTAIKFAKNSADINVCLNNIAKTHQELKEYDKALKIYHQILKETSPNQKEYAMMLTNISLTKWIQNPNYNAAPAFLKALSIRNKENDLWGQNSSYAHLADYYAEKKPDSALYYAHKMYGITQKINNPDEELTALRKLINFCPPKETKKYFNSYQLLIDSTYAARSLAKNQFALIRYETEKNKSENLELQKDNTEKKYQIIEREIMLGGIILFIIILSVFSVFWYKKRKERLHLEAQNTIHENLLKTSKKVHDVVANGLYRVMTEIENQTEIDKNHILDKIEDMYEKSRDISYDQPPTNQSFHEKIAGLLHSFSAANINIVVSGHTANLWGKVNEKAKYEIEHILQELMVNMKRHSKATQVEVLFEEADHQILIHYLDNGIGLAENNQFNNGLTNTGIRIKNISGTITFDTKLERGLKIQISFPIA